MMSVAITRSKAASREWHDANVTLPDCPQALLGTKSDCFRAIIKSDHFAETHFMEHPQIGAGAGADVEDLRISRQGEGADQTCE